jgi:hypothetical protein
MPRIVKLGRKNAGWPALHCAVKVGSVWYEIMGKGGDSVEKGGCNAVHRNSGDAADSGAGSLGGEIVGETTKSDWAIDSFIQDWLTRNETYSIWDDNCQKFAYEFIYFLTDGVNFRLPHRFDAALTAQGLTLDVNSFAVNKDGIAIARVGMGETRASAGPLNTMYRAPSAEASVVAGAGLGAWAGVSPLGRAEVNLGPLVGAHFEPNLNTGLGVRDGNLDVHVLGFGTRIGADGLEINTLLGGVNACVIA